MDLSQENRGCEKYLTCKCRSDACLKDLAADPAIDKKTLTARFSTPEIASKRRWLDCQGWKQTLGLEFNAKFGVYIPKGWPL